MGQSTGPSRPPGTANLQPFDTQNFDFDLTYDAIGEYELDVEAKNGVNQARATKVINVVNRIGDLSCYFNDLKTGQTELINPLFLEPDSSGFVSVNFNNQSEARVNWQYEDEEYSTKDIPELFTFKDVGEHIFQVTARNQLETVSNQCIIIVQDRDLTNYCSLYNCSLYTVVCITYMTRLIFVACYAYELPKISLEDGA